MPPCIRIFCSEKLLPKATPLRDKQDPIPSILLSRQYRPKKDERRRIVIPYTHRKRKIPLYIGLFRPSCFSRRSVLAPHSTTNIPEKGGTIESSQKDARENFGFFEPSVWMVFLEPVGNLVVGSVYPRVLPYVLIDFFLAVFRVHFI